LLGLDFFLVVRRVTLMNENAKLDDHYTMNVPKNRASFKFHTERSLFRAEIHQGLLQQCGMLGLEAGNKTSSTIYWLNSMSIHTLTDHP
jgi:hypothetical protein